MITYERVTYKPERGRARSVYLQDPREVNGPAGSRFIAGTRVNRDGDEIQPDAATLRKAGAEYGTITDLIELVLVTRREPMVMDLRYGWLVPAGTETRA